MPKIVTQNLQDSQAKHQQKFWKRFYLYRRQWNVGESKYEYEETAIEITDWIINCGSLSWQLDTEALNVWKDSNVALIVKNKNDEWNISNKDGVFYNKQIKDSKIQIKIGNILSDGTEDLIYIYTGVIKDIIRDYENQKATIYLLGYGSIFDRYSAESLSDNQVTDETLGTGDGIEVDFYTDEKGVGKIKVIYLNGVEQEIPTDYSVSQLNDKDNYAKITFDTAPENEVVVTCDYTYWYQNKRIHYLVEKLVESVGLTSDDYEIENVIFDNLILLDQDWDSEAEFNACQTKQEVEVLGEGSVRQIFREWVESTTADFDAGVTKDNINTADDEIKITPWGEIDQSQTSVVGGGYNLSTDGEYAAQSFETSATGWIPTIKLWIRNSDLADDYVVICSVCNDSGGGGNTPGGVLATSQLLILANTNAERTFNFSSPAKVTDGIKMWVKLTILSGGDPDEYDLTWAGADGNPYADGNAWHSVYGHYTDWDMYFKIYLNTETAHFRSQEKDLGQADSAIGIFDVSFSAASGCSYVFKVRTYNDSAWGDWLTVTDEQDISSLSPADKIQYDIVFTTTDGTNVPTVTDVTIGYIRGGDNSYCKLMTQNVDCETGLETFSLFENIQQLNGQTLEYFTQSAPDDEGSPGEWESEQEISENGQINSTCTPGITRFLRGIVYFKTDDAATRPVLQKITLSWTIASYNIVLANFTNLTVKKAIEDLAEMPDYEIGFNATGKFFFRKKSVDTSIDYVLEKGRNVNGLLRVDDGFERVKNYIEATFGDYSKVMSVKLEDEARPDSIDKYGEKRLVISGGNLLVASNIDVATGIAMRYYGFYSSNQSLTSLNYPRPKMRCAVITKMIPQIDLADTISLTYPIYKEEKYAHLFDGFTFNDFVFGTSSLAFDGKLMKVIGIILDLEGWFMELLLEEI